MNRRSIFKVFAGAVCASAMEVTGLKPVAAPVQKMVGLNPEYLTAEYEDVYLWNPDAMSVLRIKRTDSGSSSDAPQIPMPEMTHAVGSEEALRSLPDSITKIADPRIPRYQLRDGAYVQIYQYTELP